MASLCGQIHSRLVVLGTCAMSAVPTLAFAQVDTSEGDALLMMWGLIFLVFSLIYMIPTIIGFARNHPNRWLILLINAVFGATVLGWFGSLIWALSAVHRSSTGNHGGESGLNLFINDPVSLRLEATEKPSAPTLDVSEQLRRLKTLHGEGSLTDAEYQRLRSLTLERLLGHKPA